MRNLLRRDWLPPSKISPKGGPSVALSVSVIPNCDASRTWIKKICRETTQQLA